MINKIVSSSKITVTVNFVICLMATLFLSSAKAASNLNILNESQEDYIIQAINNNGHANWVDPNTLQIAASSLSSPVITADSENVSISDPNISFNSNTTTFSQTGLTGTMIFQPGSNADLVVNLRGGDFKVGQDLLHVDGSGRVGIKNDSPTAVLDVEGSGANVTSFGNVRSNRLNWGHVFGLQRGGGIMTVVEGGSTETPSHRRHMIYSNDSGAKLGLFDNAGHVNIALSAFSDTYFVGTNVGIGTRSPQKRLHVYDGSSNSNGIIKIGGAHPSQGVLVGYEAIGSGRGGFSIPNQSGGANNYFSFGFGEISGGLPSQKVMTVNQAGRVGIGTTQPSEQLDVDGNLRLSGALMPNGSAGSAGQVLQSTGPNSPPVWAGLPIITSTVSSSGVDSIDDLSDSSVDNVRRNIFLGQGSGVNVTPLVKDSTALGINAMHANQSGTQNTAIGSKVLSSNLSGDNNTGLGFGVLERNTAGERNTGLGALSLQMNQGNNNTSVGYSALKRNSSGASNTALGADALFANSGGNNNTAVGYSSMFSNTGSNNTAIGYYSLKNARASHNNVASGYESLRYLDTGNNNLASGYQSLRTLRSGSSNVAMGAQALRSAVGHSTANVAVGYGAGHGQTNAEFYNSTLVGYQAGYNLKNGNNNLLLGYRAGDNLVGGSGNVIIGYDVEASTSSAGHEFRLGTGNRILLHGKLFEGKLGVNEVNPVRNLHISDVMRITPRVSPPSGAAIGDVYVDSSGSLCFYTGSTWSVAAGTGSCS